jgi:hypothetical protein
MDIFFNCCFCLVRTMSSSRPGVLSNEIVLPKVHKLLSKSLPFSFQVYDAGELGGGIKTNPRNSFAIEYKLV